MTWAGVLGFAMMARFAAADTTPVDGNPYSVISDRNVFHLNPPPPPPPPPEAKPIDLPKIMLTGFVGKGKYEKVLLAIPPKDNKESTTFLSLAPDEMQKEVRLVAIRREKEEVDIINQGTPQTLSVKSNSYSSVAAAAPPGGKGAAPGMPTGIGLRRQPPGFPPPNTPNPQRAPPTAAANPPSEGGSAIVAGGAGGGSAIIAGGGSAPAGSGSLWGAYASSSTGAIVGGGGGGGYAATPAAATGNNVGSQIATSLFNPTTGHYQMPIPAGPPAPPVVQAAGLLIHQAAGGPPAPPSVNEAAEGIDGPPPP